MRFVAIARYSFGASYFAEKNMGFKIQLFTTGQDMAAGQKYYARRTMSCSRIMFLTIPDLLIVPVGSVSVL